MTENLKTALLRRAGDTYGTVLPCGSRERLEECFTQDAGILAFWFNTADGSTHVFTIDLRSGRQARAS